jgi:cbb3-type cytochrome oxidase maturation protein
MQMSVLIILIIVSVLVAGGFLIAFLWSVNSGQMEDDYTPSVRMLFDDELTEKNKTKSKIQS